ncbi:MAG TPA: hypothetical protein VFN35_33130 [Ktedonobacteraceae bacterium]|nr:hypothetical protein [Ktedonobacteraceae bacterium]
MKLLTKVELLNVAFPLFVARRKAIQEKQKARVQGALLSCRAGVPRRFPPVGSGRRTSP